MRMPEHTILIERVPAYGEGEKKGSQRKIREFLLECGFDEDFAEAANDDFCRGFGAARDAIIGIMKERYWQQHGNGTKQKGNGTHEK